MMNALLTRSLNKNKSFIINLKNKNTIKKNFSESDCYYLKYHGENSINKDIYNTRGSYFNREKSLAKDATPKPGRDVSSFEYDFENANLHHESEFAKNYRNQVLAICLNEHLLKDQAVLKKFIPEAIEKAKKYKSVKLGAYSCAKGIDFIRNNIAKFIGTRDNFEADPEDIYLTYGGIDAYHHILGLIFNKGDEIIMPSPSYPVYLAYNKSLHLKNIFYQFNTHGIDLQDLHYKLNYNFNGGETSTQRPKAMVVINPNNPTGRLLTKEQMEELVVFCVDNRLALIACEVLQDLAHSGDFISFRSVINSMPAPYNKLELFSTHSASKSNLFNSGARAGYLNTLNITPEIKNQLYKHISMDICSGLPGQIMMDLTLSPPSMEEGIFTPEFIQRYNASIRLSKHIHREIVLDVRDALASTKLFTFIAPKAGFTFFLNFNVNYICDHSANRKVLMGSEPLCNIYTNQLFKEKQILVTPGNDYGNFPNSVVINLYNHFQADTIKKLLEFNESFLNNMIDH